VSAVRETVAIRQAEPADWPAIAALQTRSWRSAYRGMVSDAYLADPVEADRIALWRGRFAKPADPDRIVMVAEDGDAGVVGLACILAGHDPVWGSLIDNLHVDPDRKRGGIGRAVVTAAVRLVPEHQCDSPVHLTVLDANAAAQAVYGRWAGQRSERLVEPGPDGQRVAVRRYVWPRPAALLAALGARP
jgi:ribosomal protein S18 acetylase RimI-like enzyme